MPAHNPTLELIRQQLLVRAPLGSFRDRIEMYEGFDKAPVLAATLDPATVNQAALRLYTCANKSFVYADVAGTGSCVLGAEGGCTLTSGATANNGSAILPLTTINSVDASGWGKAYFKADKEVHAAFKINLPAITSLTLHVGLCLTSALDVTTDDDQAVFVFAPASSAYWTAATSIGGTDAAPTLVCSTTVAANTEYLLEIKIDSSRVPRFYVNGVLIATGSALTTGISLIPMIKVKTTTSAGKAVDVRALRISRKPL